MVYTREEACLAWLTCGGLPPEGLQRLLEDHGSAEAVYERFRDDSYFICEYASRTCMNKLYDRAGTKDMHQMLTVMQHYGMHVMTPEDDAYPRLLKEIDDFPLILFYCGDPSCLHEKCITMVGSRSASPYGCDMAHQVAGDFARSGVTVVSGFARGIDAASHTGCMDAGGRTAAVMGCGLDVAYPAEHGALRRRILDTGGVLLSEYPPGSPPAGWHFPVRNRILSGLSRATVMMECRQQSGSMVTVQHALDQGREVFAYPGVAGTNFSEGAHMLLREGATYFSFAEDILCDLGWNKLRDTGPAQTKSALSERQQRILAALHDGAASCGQLLALTGLPEKELTGELTVLQLLGFINQLPGKTYARV